jgi:thioredoxin-like negative regulator of GroEL
LENFDKVVMQEDKDVVLLLYAQNCEPCANFAVYFKKMAERFKVRQTESAA